MSTSDPHRPSGATDRPDPATTPATTDETPELAGSVEPVEETESIESVEETTPASDDAPAHEVAPTVETLDPPPSSEPETPAARSELPESSGVPVTTAPFSDSTAAPETVGPSATTDAPGTVDSDLSSTTTAAAPVATRGTSEPATDTGRHAIVRPAPTPPDEPAAVDTPPDPVRSPVAPTTTEPTTDPTPEPVSAPGAAAPLVGAAGVATDPAPATVPEDDGRLFPDPNAPRSTSVGSHILGVLVGLVLAPIGVAVLLVGESRILQAQVNGWDASTEVVGIVLVSAGLLLLGCVLLLALWTPAVPITGGTILTLAGIVYLYLPSIAREQTLNLLSSSGWRVTVTQVTVAGTSGMVLAVGFLLLLAGIVAASARRRGVRLGEFRERHRI